ncbi:MAG: sigma-54 dependent transcriptional regulator [Polyangiales bacterium]
MATVLVIDDERGVREGLCRAVTAAGHRAIPAAGVAEARAAIAKDAPDCVLLDVRLKDGDGIAFLSELKGGLAPDAPVIMATAYGDSERTIGAMKGGAFDYVTKPSTSPAPFATVERAVRQRDPGRSGRRIPRRRRPRPRGRSSAESAAMLAVWKMIGRASPSDAPVLLTGETGTGKEPVARAIHQHSSRASGPFVAVNLAALPETSSRPSRPRARSLHRRRRAQARSHRASPPGDVAPPRRDRRPRPVAPDAAPPRASRRTLRARRRHRGHPPAARASSRPRTSPCGPASPARTREDLYYCLAVIEPELPPLRARRSDIPLLVAHALASSPARAVSEEAMNLLQSYAWPGNVRELVHVVQRAAVMCGAEVIDVGDLQPALRATPSLPPVSPGGPDGPGEPYASMPMRDAVSLLEKRMIEMALAKSGGNRAEAARVLGIARPQLYAKMDEHGLANRAKE